MSAEIKTMLEGFIAAQESKLQTISAKADEAIAKANGQAEYKSKIDTEVVNEVRELSEQYKSVAASLNEMAQRQSSVVAGPAQSQKTPAQEFVESDSYKSFVAAGGRGNARVECKGTVLSDSTTVFPQQMPGIIPGDRALLTVRDVIRSITVTSPMVHALREQSFVDSANFISQGATKPESDIAFEQYNVAVETVADTMKVTQQLIQDAPSVISYIEQAMRYGLASRVEKQLLNGNGTAPQLSGFTKSGNHTVYTPTSDDLLTDAINRAMRTMQAATGQTPDVVIVNPATWGMMERTRESTGSGNYLYGLPGAMVNMTAWGARVILSSNIDADKFIVANMTLAAEIYQRQGVTVEVGFVNDDFQRNLATLRIEERLGLAIKRPSLVYYGQHTA